MPASPRSSGRSAQPSSLTPTTTIHTYTNDQKPLDFPHRDFRLQHQSLGPHQQRDWINPNTANTFEDHDVSGTFGGPIKRDRMWFFSPQENYFYPDLAKGLSFFLWSSDPDDKREWESIMLELRGRVMPPFCTGLKTFRAFRPVLAYFSPECARCHRLVDRLGFALEETVTVTGETPMVDVQTGGALVNSVPHNGSNRFAGKNSVLSTSTASAATTTT